MAKEQRAQPLARAGDDGDREVAAHRHMARRHAAEAPVAGVAEDVITANHRLCLEGRGKQSRRARQPQAGEGLHRRAHQRDEAPDIHLATGIPLPLEIGAIRSTGHLGRRLQKGLDQAGKVELRHQGAADTVERLQRARLLTQKLLGLGAGDRVPDAGRHVLGEPDVIGRPATRPSDG